MNKIKGGKRVRKNSKFVIPSVEEQAKDRKDYLSMRVIEIVQDGDRLKSMFHNLDVMESKIDIRMKQLGINEKWEQVKEPDVKERFEGMIKTIRMLRSEHNALIHLYKTQIREFEKMKDKFVKEYKFKDTDVKKIITGEFNWSGWEKSELEVIDGDTKKNKKV